MFPLMYLDPGHDLPFINKWLDISKKKVVIVLVASEWSGSSQIMEGYLSDIAKTSNQIEKYVIDVEEYSEIVEYLGVTKIPSSVIIYKSNIVDIIEGTLPISRIRKRIDSVLYEE